MSPFAQIGGRLPDRPIDRLFSVRQCPPAKTRCGATGAFWAGVRPGCSWDSADGKRRTRSCASWPTLVIAEDR